MRLEDEDVDDEQEEDEDVDILRRLDRRFLQRASAARRPAAVERRTFIFGMPVHRESFR